MNWNFNKRLYRQAPGDPGAGGEPVITPPADPGPDLSFIPADFHTDGKADLGKFSAHYQEIVARDAQRAQADAEKAKLVPEGDYDFAIDPDLKFEGLQLPEGFTATLQLEDEAFKPIFANLSGMLKEIGAPASAAKGMMGLLAQYEAVQYDRAMKAMTTDMAKLGTPAQVDARIATIARALDTRLPAEQATALKGMARSSAALQALETLVMGNRSMTPPQQVPPGAQNEGLSPYERLKLANSQS